MQRRLSVLVLVVSLQFYSSSCLSERGVHPDVIARYQTASTSFSCLDGSKSVPSSYLNDNFCDCADGSDEPDCCDGTDEPAGACKNNCFEQSASIRQALRDKAQDIIEAVNHKDQLIKDAAVAKAAAEARVANIDPEIEEADVEVSKLEEEVALLEEQKRKEEAELAEADAAAAAAAQAGAAGEPVAAAEPSSGSEEGAAEGLRGDADAEGAAGASGEVDEESAEERGRRIASQWTHDPEAAADAEHSAEQHVEAAALEEADPFEEADHQHHHWEADDVPEHQTPLDEAHAKLTDARTKATALKDEKERLQKHLGLDMGPGGVFWHLAGKCFSVSDARFTYEACFYDDSSQSEGHSKTKIGSWQGFGTVEGGTAMVAKFTEGDWCWEGPNRSLTLELECGREVELHSPSEPSKCVYTAKLKTPAACEPAMALEMQQAVARLEALEAEFKAEAAPVHDEL